MQMHPKLKSLLEVRAGLEKVFFKKFMSIYIMPKELNRTHMITILTLAFKKTASMSYLSKKINMEKGSFTPVAKTLIRLDYVVKERDLADKRVYNLTLTEKGKKAAHNFQIAHYEYIKSRLSVLDEEQIEQFLNGVKQMNEVLRLLQNDDLQANEKTDSCGCS